MTKYGYARVSTKEQDLSDQRERLEQQGVDHTNIYAEKYTGTKMDRPEWTKLQQKLQKGDTLIVTKLDRLARTMLGALTTIEELRHKGVSIKVLNDRDNVVMDDSPMGRAMTKMILTFAELERDMIVTRTQEGKAYAKAHNQNYKEGRPKRKITPQYEQAYQYSLTHSVRDTAKLTGLSERTIYRIRKQINDQK